MYKQSRRNTISFFN